MRPETSNTDRFVSNAAEWYRVLSYYFGVICAPEEFQSYPQRVLSPFRIGRDSNEHRKPPTPGIPPIYSLIRVEPPEPLRFRLLFGNELLYGSDRPGPVLDHFFWHVNSEAIRHTGDFYLVHAGVVSIGERAMLLPAGSGSGKSTLVTSLVLKGFDYLSDEAAAIDPVTRRVYPYARAISLKPDVLEGVFKDLAQLDPAPELSKGHWHLLPEVLRAESVGEPSEVSWVVVPKYEAGVETAEVQRMSRGRAAYELGRNAMNSSRYGSRGLEILGDIVSEADCFRLTYGHLTAAARQIDLIVGQGSNRT